MGERLNIVNSFPRTEAQRDLLRSISEGNFVRTNWSLHHLLERILLSDYFNRLPPAVGAGATPYDLPLVFDPWVEADPRAAPANDPAYRPEDHPERHNNAMTESIHRYSARSLLHSVHAGLGWPDPLRFRTCPEDRTMPNNNDGCDSYPNDELRKAIGQFYSDAEPGFRDTDFQGLLHWETVLGTCQKPQTLLQDDWIDRLLGATPAFDSQHVGAPLTLADLVITIRDWLIADSRLGAAPRDSAEDERQSLLSFFAPLALDDTVAALPAEELEVRLRCYCGVLVKTPQFMLAGFAPRELGSAPRMRVCSEAPCTYREMCEVLKPAVEFWRYAVTCQEESVAIQPVPQPPPITAVAEALCRKTMCEFLPLDVRLECFADGRFCPRNPPPLDERGVFLAWAEGGSVRIAEGVEILRHGKEQFVGLRPGNRLGAGDLLRIPPGSQLRIQTSESQFSTPKAGAPKPESAPAWLFMVTGESVLKSRDRVQPGRILSIEEVDKQLRSGSFAHGAVGPIPDPRTTGTRDERRLRASKPGAKPQYTR